MTAKDYSSLDNGYIGVAYGGSRQYALRETLYRRVETTNIYINHNLRYSFLFLTLKI